MATARTQSHIELSENHRRSISITLQLVDKALCEWDDWAKGNVRSGVMFREQDMFSPTKRPDCRKKSQLSANYWYACAMIFIWNPRSRRLRNRSSDTQQSFGRCLPISTVVD
jgi:hypothetical protein